MKPGKEIIFSMKLLVKVNGIYLKRFTKDFISIFKIKKMKFLKLKKEIYQNTLLKNNYNKIHIILE